jgi:hypothetical protein
MWNNYRLAPLDNLIKFKNLLILIRIFIIRSYFKINNLRIIVRVLILWLNLINVKLNMRTLKKNMIVSHKKINMQIPGC